MMRIQPNLSGPRSRRSWLWAALLSSVLVACGGGGGGGSTPAPDPAGTPSIAAQPLSATVSAGLSVTFTVNAAATTADPLAYQWYKNDVAIDGATEASYTIPVVSYLTDRGAKFKVVVTNTVLGGAVTSAEVTLSVNPYNASSLCSVTGNSTSNDPLIGYAWHIKNNNLYFASTVPTNGTGFDLCMGTLWAQTTPVLGTNVKVNVVDSGLELTHEDLSGQIIAGASYNFNTSTTDPTSTETEGDHGTSVAGLIAATRGNAKGSAGVAPGAGLMGYNFLDSAQTTTMFGVSFGTDPNHQSSGADVFNFSAGNTSAGLAAPSTTQDSTIANLLQLRDGKGAVFVKSAGNGFSTLGKNAFGQDIGYTNYCKKFGVSCQSANQDNNNKQQNAIVVASLNADGSKSSYSTTGSSVWISGFGGEYGGDVTVAGAVYDTKVYKPAMLTTDQSDCTKGYSRSSVFLNRLDNGSIATNNSSCNYTATFNGTSSAAPTVSGVVALMLQANPNLTWRDVRHILASTARRVNATSVPIYSDDFDTNLGFLNEQGWVLNAGGYYFHNWYGFGLVNASAAVAMARTHQSSSLGTYGAESATADFNADPLPYDINGVSNTFAIAGSTVSVVEQAELMLQFGSYMPLCVQVELTSPRGTKSIVMHANSAHTAAATGGVRMVSNAFYGEPAAGNWSLKFIDTCGGNTLSITPQQLTIRGH
jgi:subtilisin family serine protease